MLSAGNFLASSFSHWKSAPTDDTCGKVWLSDLMSQRASHMHNTVETTCPEGLLGLEGYMTIYSYGY